MGGSFGDYQVAYQRSNQVAQSAYSALEKIVNGKHNLGEIVLRNGEFVTVNNHAYLTMLNGTVTTKQDNLNVRTAVAELLTAQFVGLRDLGENGLLALQKVKDRLLGNENRMMPISRNEVREMINALKDVRQGFGFHELRSTQLRTTVNSNAYQTYASSRAKMACKLAASAGKSMGDGQANKLADLVVSRSRLYQEDLAFNGLIADFKAQTGARDDELATKLFKGLRDKMTREIESYDSKRLAEFTADYNARNKKNFSLDDMRKVLFSGISAFIDRHEKQFRSLVDVKVVDGRVTDMESLMDQKATILKQLLIKLLMPGYNLAEAFADELSVDVEVVKQQRAQQEEDAVDARLKEASADLRATHPTAADELDAWSDQIRHLSGDASAAKVAEINEALAKGGARSREGFEIVLTPQMFKDLQQPEMMLDFKRQYVRAFTELHRMGFSEGLIKECLSKDLVMAGDYNVAMQNALRKLRGGDVPHSVVDSKIQAEIDASIKDVLEIRQMVDVCQKCLDRIKEENRFKPHSGDEFGDTKYFFHQDFKALSANMGARKDASSDRQLLAEKLPLFIDELLQRKAQASNRAENCAAALGKTEEVEIALASKVELDIEARLTEEFAAFI